MMRYEKLVSVNFDIEMRKLLTDETHREVSCELCFFRRVIRYSVSSLKTLYKVAIFTVLIFLVIIKDDVFLFLF